MFSSSLITTGLNISPSLLAQAPVAPALVFNGAQFFAALIAGVALAFAFQLLLTNLGVAAGISLAGGGNSSSHSHEKSDSIGSTINKIGWTVGLGTLVSVTIALFFASLLAVRLGLYISPAAGAIVGLTLWAIYFCLMAWVSSATVGSFVGSVVNAATSGLQALIGTATAAIGGKAVNKQVVATAEAAAAAVRRELGTGIDAASLRENLQDYLEALRPPELNWQRIYADLEDLLADPRLQEIDDDRLASIDRQTFVDLIRSRSDLSDAQVNRIADRLESAWKSKVKRSRRKNVFSEFGDYLQSATREQLLGSELSQKLDTFIQETRKSRDSEPSKEQSGSIAQAMSLGFNSLVGMVLGRTDLSDLDVEKILARLNKLKDQVEEQTQKVAQLTGGETTYSPVRADIEHYLLDANPWQLQPENLRRDFRDLLYDPEADPGAVQRELEQINRSDFVELLERKGIFTHDKIQQIANSLEEIRLEVLSVAKAAQEEQKAIALLADIENYLINAPKEDLTPEKIQLNFRPILEDPDADYDQLNIRLARFARPIFERTLAKRQDLSPTEAAAIIDELEIARERVLQESQEQQAAIKIKAEQQWLKVQSYLRDTGKEELNPQAIERELQLLLHDPQAGAAVLRERLSHFDRDTLVQLLAQRQDISQEQAAQIVDRVERIWTRVRYAPQQLTGKAKEQYEKTTSAIENYLRSTGKEELNPEGIKRDLTRLLEDPKAGAKAIRHRLAMMDRDTLVKLFGQREDLSEEQVNQIIDQVQEILRSFARAPRRLARRTQQQVREFRDAIADYLRSTDREELNPEGIQRDIELLLHDRRAGVESLKERLAHFDRDTLVALLSQREDISEAEVNRIIDQIFLVRDRFLIQLQSIQNRIQSIIDGIFLKIRDYLNSLERPELNYEGIKGDLRTLFDDPQAGFEALRDRFSQIDRNTLVAILSSRPDISKEDAQRIIGQIEGTRDRILQKAERLQQQAQLRLEQVKQETQRQMEETRKAAATAAWWLFLTALISAAAAAGGGVAGVIGIV